MRAAMLVIIGLGFSSFAFAHPTGESRVVIEAESNLPAKSTDNIYSFQLVDTANNKVITDSNLQVSNQMKLHLFAYDPALKEFQHAHPVFDGKVWNVALHFAASGNYWLWVQGQLNDGTDFTSSVRLDVQVANAAWPVTPLSDLRSGSADISVASLDGQKLKANQMAMLTLTFSRNDGTTAVITPYLGAFAHVVIVTDDADSLIHVHPMNTSNPNEGMLHATFPNAGLYRLWVQFMDGGILKVVPLAVEVF